MKSSHQKKIAISLSAFVLPGLGQLHLKQKSKGWVMILLCLATLILTFWKYMMGILQVTEQSFHQKREPLSMIGKQLWQALLLEKTWLLAGLIFLAIIWAWSLVDLWKDEKFQG